MMKQSHYLRFFAGMISAMMTAGFLTVMPMTSFADELVTGETSDHFTYEITQEHVKITGYTGERETVTSLHIPETADGKPVDMIGSGAFKNCIALAAVEIPATVTCIENNAFENTALTEIHFPKDIKILEYSLFYNTPTLKEITFPAGLEKAASVLRGSSVETVTIEPGMTTVPDYLCQYAENIKTLSIPDSVTSLGYGFLADSKGIKDFTLPVQVTEAKAAFHYSELETIRFPEGCEAVPDDFCNGANQLKTVEWASTITKIGDSAFNSTALKSADIPNSVKQIGRAAFYWCPELESVHFPENGCEIGNVIFANCTALKEVNIPAGLTGEGDLSIFVGSGLKTITFATGVAEIPKGFCYNSPVEQVNLPDGLKTIGSGAFQECSSLRSIDIPDSVTEIKENAFYKCYALADMELPKTIEKIGTTAFGWCTSLRTITIPKTLETFHVGGTASNYQDIFGNSGMVEATIEDGAETVTKGLFCNCKMLETVHIPASVTHIDDAAFDGCISLHTLDMPHKAGDIMPGEGGFHCTSFLDCDSLYDERFSMYQPGKTYVNRVVAVPGENGLINYTVYYSVNPLFIDAMKARGQGGYIDVSTSYDNEILAESLPDGIRPEEITDSNRRIKNQNFPFDVNETEGVFRFSTRPTGENLDVQIKLCLWLPDNYSFNYPYKQTIPVNNNADGAEPVSLEAPVFAAWQNGMVSLDLYGYAPFGSDVTLYVNGEAAKTVTASKFTGSYYANLQVQAEKNGTLSVYAQSGEKKSAEKQICTDTERIDVEKLLLFHNNMHCGVSLDITDAYKQGKTTYLAYNPSMPLGFEATLSDNDCAAVFVTSTVNDETSAIELFYDENSKTWKGDGFFKTRVPGTLNVVAYCNQYDPVMQIDTGSTGNQPSVKLGNLNMMTAAPEEETDAARDFVKREKVSLVAADENGYLSHAEYTVNGEPGAATFYTGKSDSVFIDGNTVTKEEILKNPEAHGFIKASGQAVDETGAVHTYYVRTVTDDAAAAALAAHLYVTEENQREPKPGMIGNAVNDIVRSVAEFFSKYQDTAASACSGSIVVEQIQSAVVGEENKSDIVTTLVTETTKTKLSDYLNSIGKGALDTSISTAMTVTEIGVRTVGYGGELSEIYHSDKYGLDNKIAFTTVSTGIFAARVGSILYGGAVVSATVGAVVAGTVSGPAIAGAALVVGAVIGINKLIDIVHNWFRPQFSGQAVLTSGFKLKYLIDPSGIAYEWVPSNPVKGVKAEIYYKDENGNAVLWNAEDYEQVNPQITDSAGWFAWDVPEGLWQVKLTAEGYDAQASEWLPVLPVQTNVNLKLSSRLPSKIAKAATDGKTVEVQFTKHMLDETITEDSLYLTDASGNKIPCTMAAVKESDNDTNATMYFTLTPETAVNPEGCTLHLTADAKSYAGIASTAEEMLISGKQLTGDVNGDHKISIADAVFLARYTAEDTSIHADILRNITESGVADVTGDGETDTFDVTELLRIIAGTAA